MFICMFIYFYSFSYSCMLTTYSGYDADIAISADYNPGNFLVSVVRENQKFF